MEINQLRSFICVASVGSFTEAAEQLALSQPALSLQIKALERELGQPLFERRNRRIYLTEAGHILLNRSRQVMDLLAQTRLELDGLVGLAHGRLRIGAGDTVCLYLFPTVVRSFSLSYPGIELHLTNRPSSEIVALLQAGEIDFGVATLPQPDHARAGDLETRPLLRRQDVLICAPQHPLAQLDAPALSDLCRHTLLLLDPTSTSRLLLDRLFLEAGLQPQISDLGSVEVIKRYVAIGLGISIAPAFAVVGEVERGELHAIPLPWLPPIQIGIVTRRKGVRSPAAQAFLALLETDIRSRFGDIPTRRAR